MINETSSKFKTFSLRETPLIKWKESHRVRENICKLYMCLVSRIENIIHKNHMLCSMQCWDRKKNNWAYGETWLSDNELWVNRAHRASTLYQVPDVRLPPPQTCPHPWLWHPGTAGSGDIRLFMLISSLVNSISSMPSLVEQCRKALHRNMTMNCSKMQLSNACMATLLLMKEVEIFSPWDRMSQTAIFTLLGIHSHSLAYPVSQYHLLKTILSPFCILVFLVKD